MECVKLSFPPKLMGADDSGRWVQECLTTLTLMEKYIEHTKLLVSLCRVSDLYHNVHLGGRSSVVSKAEVWFVQNWCALLTISLAKIDLIKPPQILDVK